MGWLPALMCPCQRQSTRAAPLYSTCCWSEVPWRGSQTDRKKAGRGGTHGCTHTPPAGAHPHMRSHKYWVYTDMYSYLQVSSPNFKLLRFVNSVSPIFPFWSCLVFFRTAQIFLRSSSLFIFHQLSVTPCFTRPRFLFFSPPPPPWAYDTEWTWIFHNPPYLCCFCTTHLNATGVSWICVKCYNRLLREKLKKKKKRFNEWK